MRTIKEALEDGSLSLEDEIDYADMTEEDYKKEIERLNNIINELNNFLDKQIEKDKELLNHKKSVKPYGEEKNYYEISMNRLFEVKNKLQELKGDSSNE